MRRLAPPVTPDEYAELRREATGDGFVIRDKVRKAHGLGPLPPPVSPHASTAVCIILAACLTAGIIIGIGCCVAWRAVTG